MQWRENEGCHVLTSSL